MKKTLKLTSLLFTLILAVSVVFTGCGNGRKDSTTKGTTENNNASATTEDNLVDDAEDALMMWQMELEMRQMISQMVLITMTMHMIIY